MNFLTLLPVIIMLICFMIKIPIAYSMFCGCITYFIVAGKNIGLVADVSMGALYGNTTIVAVPLFIFAANIMNASDVTSHMFTFVKALIGKRRGATAYINIIISLIFSGMSGSGLADVCGMGSMEVAEMEKDGYDSPFSCALTAATAVVGPIFPPSIPLVVYGMLAEVSVGSLFLGGIVPAFMICVALAGYVWYISSKRGYPTGHNFTAKEFLNYTWKALPALLTPVILLGGIYTGVVTTTEAGALACFYTILISIFIYKNLSFKRFIQVVKETTIQSGVVMVCVLSAWVLSYVVASTGLAGSLRNWFLTITENKYIFLLIVNVVFLLLGMVFDTQVLQFVIIPLVVPIAEALGINLVHFGVVLAFNMMLGCCTPPYGSFCFSIAAIMGCSLPKIYKEVLPMALLMMVVLLIITYVPELVMFIPNLSMG